MENVKLFAHQARGLELAKKQNMALFWSCGSGKTILALSIIDHFKSSDPGLAVVVCPKSIMYNAWQADAAKFFPELKVVVAWDKNPKVRLRLIQSKADVLVMNYETLKNNWPDVRNRQPKVLIIDESSKMKSARSQITAAVLAMAGQLTRGSKNRFPPLTEPVPHRYVLSGTPAPNHYGEYWAQVKFVSGRGKCFHDNYYVFRSKYFWSVPIGNNCRIFKFRANLQNELLERIKPYSDIVKLEDCVDLPEQLHVIRNVELTYPERRAYNDFKKDLVIRIGDNEIVGENVLVEIMKLRQMASGFVYLDGDDIRLGRSKLNELEQVLDEMGDEQVIIWCNFKYEIESIRDMLKDECVTLYSDTDDRESSVKDFKDGRAQYLVANPQSAGHGLTFVESRYSVYFSHTYSYEYYEQSLHRQRRIGQNRTQYCYYLVATDTIDEVIMKTLRNKGDMSKAALEALR